MTKSWYIHSEDKNEKENILKNYANGRVPLRFFCNKKSGENIFFKFYYSTNYERPDMYYVNNKCCYIFEHFEIDASLYKKKKGSLYKMNANFAEKKLEALSNNIIQNSKIDKDKVNSCGSCCVTANQEAKKDYLKSNFIRIFYDHYKNIQFYKDNLKTHLNLKNQKFKIIFIIEDTTEFGGFLLKNGKPEDLKLFYCDFVVDMLKSARDIDYFIFLDSEKVLNVIKNGKFAKLEKHILNFDKEKIVFINQVISTNTPIFLPKQN